MEKKSGAKVVKSSIWYIVSNILLKGLSFFTVPIFTRLMNQQDFGNFSNFTSWISILTIVGTISLHSSLVSARFDFKDDLDSYNLSILTLGSLFTLGMYAVISLNFQFFERVFSMTSFYINVMFSYIMVSQTITIFQNIQRFKYKYKQSVFISLFASLSSIITSLYLVNVFEDKLLGRIIGFYLPLIAINLILYIGYIRKGKYVKLKYWKYAIKICIPFVTHLLSLTILASSDRIMITNILGSTQTALYSLAYSISTIVVVLWSSINVAFSPWLGEKIHENNTKAVYKISTVYVLVIAVPIVGIMLIAPEVLYIMGGKAYMDAKYVMPPVMVACFLQYVYTMYVNVEQYKKKTIGMMVASVLAATLNVILNFKFIPYFGYIGAAYSTMLCYGVLLVFHYLLVKKMNLAHIYNTKNILIIIVIVLIISFVVLLLYNNTILRYFITLGYGVALTYLLKKYWLEVKIILKKK
nr:oligosaccharide flippase family protein [uncultured Trichococcus sp.]